MKQPEEILFGNYIAEVREQLECNVDEYWENITFDFTNEQIDKHLDYFELCLDKGLSAYRALDGFDEHLDWVSYLNWRNHKRIINGG